MRRRPTSAALASLLFSSGDIEVSLPSVFSAGYEDGTSWRSPKVKNQGEFLDGG